MVELVETTRSSAVEPVDTTPLFGGRACRDHATHSAGEPSRPRRSSVVELVETTTGRAAGDSDGPRGRRGTSGSGRNRGPEKSSKIVPRGLWRTPFSGADCRWSMLELGHDQEHRRPRHRRRGARVRAGRSAAAEAAEANKLQAAVTWAGMHSVDSWIRRPPCGTTARLASRSPDPAPPGRGSLGHRFAPAIGMPTEAGKAYLGEAVETPVPPERSPGRSRVTCPRRLRRGARETMPRPWRPPPTPTSTIAYVADSSAAPSSTGPSRRLSAGSCPRRLMAAAARPPPAGASPSTPGSLAAGHQHRLRELDLADALDLDAAVTAGAQACKDLGSTDTLAAPRGRGRGPRPASAHPRPQHRRRGPTADGDATPTDAAPGDRGATSADNRERRRRRARCLRLGPGPGACCVRW